MSDKCPVCSNELLSPPRKVFGTSGQIFSCPNCGRFELDFESIINLTRGAVEEAASLALLSHKIRSMGRDSEVPKVSQGLIETFLKTSRLPGPLEQVNNLLLWLGDSSSFGQLFTLSPTAHTAVAGALNRDNFVALVSAMAERGIIRGDSAFGGGFVGQLTLDGWQAYAEVKRGQQQSRRAFMAMPYGCESVDAMFSACFKPAVAETGFELFRLDDAAPAGPIDDRLRVEIRRSRFLIADLTGDNNGAYWEAGFAEGLGKPVIYTCEAGYFKTHGTHFDTNHHLTVRWREEEPGSAAETLKATIRATLPAEAVMQDSGGGEAR
jgi:hypothetical protein